MFQFVCCTLNFNRYHIPRGWLQPSSNLLVIFEETGGNPLKISLRVHFTKTICGKVSETHYPPLSTWSHPDVINGKILISNVAPQMRLQCDDGHTISAVKFASYGTPNGSCQNYSLGKCHASTSLSLVTKVGCCKSAFVYMYQQPWQLP